jgi:hypothetical protein
LGISCHNDPAGHKIVFKFFSEKKFEADSGKTPGRPGALDIKKTGFTPRFPASPFPDNRQNLLTKRSRNHTKRGSQTPISTQNARFAKRPVLKKPRKTPGFHSGQISRPFPRRSPQYRFNDLGEFSFLRRGSIKKGRPGKKCPQKRIMRLPGALYAPQFMGISAIGPRIRVCLPSVEGVYDGDGICSKNTGILP